MVCSIHLTDVPPNIWDNYFKKVKRSNLLQSSVYGAAQTRLGAQNPRFFLIEKAGQAAGLCLCLESKALGGFLHAVTLDRGPVWLDGNGDAEDFAGFMHTFCKQFPKRPGRRVRIIPETESFETVGEVLTQYNFIRASDGYKTVWFDLEKREEELRDDMKKSWRGALTKAEKAGLTIEWDMDGRFLPWLLKTYALDKIKKGYPGPSVELVNALDKEGAPILIGRALSDGQAVAAALIILHGRSATYQIGWSGSAGRTLNANHLLLWHAVKTLKQRGIKDFDLGGINDGDGEGIKKFKTGMGGSVFTGAGLYV